MVECTDIHLVVGILRLNRAVIVDVLVKIFLILILMGGVQVWNLELEAIQNFCHDYCTLYNDLLHLLS